MAPVVAEELQRHRRERRAAVEHQVDPGGQGRCLPVPHHPAGRGEEAQPVTGPEVVLEGRFGNAFQEPAERPGSARQPTQLRSGQFGRLAVLTGERDGRTADAVRPPVREQRLRDVEPGVRQEPVVLEARAHPLTQMLMLDCPGSGINRA
jgi:hypothetical protein